MIIMNLKLDNIYGFNNFSINFSYPKKIVNSFIENEHLAGRENFRYKKAVILMGANASGKTSLGKVLRSFFLMLDNDNDLELLDLVSNNKRAKISVDFVNKDFILHRIVSVINPVAKIVTSVHYTSEIGKNDSYESCIKRFTNESTYHSYVDSIGEFKYIFAYPDISPKLQFDGVSDRTMLKSLKAIIGTLDPTLRDITKSKDLKDTYIIKRDNQEIIIQNGKLLNREYLSSGTAEGIDVAIILASIIEGNNSFYYCDEHFSYIHSEIEKRIFGIMLDNLGDNEQLIFTTHNMDMLDLNLPKHTFCFLIKEIIDDHCEVSVKYASDYLKRNTDSVRCAVENDLFGSLPDDSLLDDLEKTL